jgi:hypothetical protein
VRRVVPYLVVALVFAGALGCASHEREAMPLSGDALRATVADTQLDNVDPGRAHLHEYFCRSGQWMYSGTRAPTYGHYWISGTSLCVTEFNGFSRGCRELYRTGRGTFRIQPVDRPEGALSIRLERLRSCP